MYIPNMPKTAHAQCLGLFDLKDTIWSQWIIINHNSAQFFTPKRKRTRWSITVVFPCYLANERPKTDFLPCNFQFPSLCHSPICRLPCLKRDIGLFPPVQSSPARSPMGTNKWRKSVHTLPYTKVVGCWQFLRRSIAGTDIRERGRNRQV